MTNGQRSDSDTAAILDDGTGKFYDDKGVESTGTADNDKASARRPGAGGGGATLLVVETADTEGLEGTEAADSDPPELAEARPADDEGTS